MASTIQQLSRNLAVLILAVSLIVGCNSTKEKAGSKPMKAQPAAQAGNPQSQTLPPVQAEGGWESSGGDGVACFADSDVANKARTELQTQGHLSKIIRSKIITVQTLDSWDFLKTNQEKKHIGVPSQYFESQNFLFHPELYAMTSHEDIIELVIQNLERYTPLFGLQIRLAMEKAPLANWKASTQVKQVNDSTPAVEVTAQQNCVLIQLANRQTLSEKGKTPQTQIVYDKELFNSKLSAIERALLIMHEYLYLIGREGNHENSDPIRKFNAYAFSSELHTLDSHNVMSLRTIVGYPYGDYMRFFIDTPELDFKPVKTGTPFSRYQSLITVMKILRAKKATCLAENKKENDCHNEVVDSYGELFKDASPEVAFMFLGRFHLDKANGLYNSEHLTTWNKLNPLIQTPKQLELAEQYCYYLEETPASQLLDIVDKAFTYCRESLGVNIRSLGEREVKTYFSCFSTNHAILWHNTEAGDQGLDFNTQQDPETGRTLNPQFQGKIEFIEASSPVMDQKSIDYMTQDLGYGNRKYVEGRTYRLTPSNDEDTKLLNDFAELEPENIRKKESSGSKIISADIFLPQCIVTETTLSEALFYLH